MQNYLNVIGKLIYMIPFSIVLNDVFGFKDRKNLLFYWLLVSFCFSVYCFVLFHVSALFATNLDFFVITIPQFIFFLKSDRRGVYEKVFLFGVPYFFLSTLDVAIFSFYMSFGNLEDKLSCLVFMFIANMFFVFLCRICFAKCIKRVAGVKEYSWYFISSLILVMIAIYFYLIHVAINRKMFESKPENAYSFALISSFLLFLFLFFLYAVRSFIDDSETSNKSVSQEKDVEAAIIRIGNFKKVFEAIRRSEHEIRQLKSGFGHYLDFASVNVNQEPGYKKQIEKRICTLRGDIFSSYSDISEILDSFVQYLEASGFEPSLYVSKNICVHSCKLAMILSSVCMMVINNICYKKDRKSVSLSIISQRGVVVLRLSFASSFSDSVSLAEMKGLVEENGGIINCARDKDMAVYEMSIMEEML